MKGCLIWDGLLLYLGEPLRSGMNFLGNLIWLIFGGLATAVGYFMGGIVLMASIIGIPWGLQHFKLAGFAISPFGRKLDIAG